MVADAQLPEPGGDLRKHAARRSEIFAMEPIKTNCVQKGESNNRANEKLFQIGLPERAGVVRAVKAAMARVTLPVLRNVVAELALAPCKENHPGNQGNKQLSRMR